MSVYHRGTGEAEGFSYVWDVFRDEGRRYIARVAANGPNNEHMSVTRDLERRPSDRTACEQACIELLPRLIRTLK
jgi:hypothetical protein